MAPSKPTTCKNFRNHTANETFLPMKKITNGKLYDTDKSTFIGEGDPNSKYAEQVDNSTHSGGSAIIPLETEEARALAERYCDMDTISQYFDVEDA